jgi:hypothetical protein
MRRGQKSNTFQDVNTDPSASQHVIGGIILEKLFFTVA